METITKKNTLTDKLIAEFESTKNSLFGNLKLREQAIEIFAKQGIPNRKHEEYKYVNIDLMLKDEFSFSVKKPLTSQQIEQTKFLKDAIIIVVENGIFSQELSNLQHLPKHTIISSIATAAEDHPAILNKHYSTYADINTDPFVALNTSLAKDGVFIHIGMGTVVKNPIHIIHISSATKNTIINTRNLIVMEENVQAKIIESFKTIDSIAKAFNNVLTEVVIGNNSIVEYNKIQDETDLGYLVNTTQIIQKKQSVFTSNTFILSGFLVRNNLTMVLDGEYIESHLNGLYLTDGNQTVDNHTLVDHRKPNCNSNELYKGIIEGKSSATFNGKIYVRKDAQKTNAFQSNKNILLSDDGTINTKPQLEIYADDVKCSHGTSTGKLDADKIFYLRTRGLSEASAKKLLMHAFASEVVDMIKIDELRAYVEDSISKRFE